MLEAGSLPWLHIQIPQGALELGSLSLLRSPLKGALYRRPALLVSGAGGLGILSGLGTSNHSWEVVAVTAG